MARAANRLRQQLRPEDPTGLQFELSEDCIPADFLKADVQTRRKCLLVFATEEQLHQLTWAKNWYVELNSAESHSASCLQSKRLSKAASRQSRSPRVRAYVGEKRKITVQSLKRYWICFSHQLQSAE